jgi:uncharacterized protein YbaR (Trm112 family)
VCPATHERLERVDGWLLAAGGGRRYPVIEGVPVLLADEAAVQEYLAETGGAMADEYLAPGRAVRARNAFDRWLLRRSVLSEAVDLAIRQVLHELPAGAVCVSVGGGPDRWGEHIVNLNIGRFPGVDVVGDAYALPYADDSVDAVLCWAVLEHLELPDRAVQEIFRVLRPGGQALACTPFLQAFHAYPNHFQNLTMTGQERLMGRAGFDIVSAGPASGPCSAMLDLATVCVRTYLPGRVLTGALARALRLLIPLAGPLDRRLMRSRDGHVLASSVFVHARKAT